MLTEQAVSGEVGAGSGSTGNHVEPALPIRPTSSTAVRLCSVVVSTFCHLRALGTPLGEGLVTALCLLYPPSAGMLQDRSPSCAEQDSSHHNLSPAELLKRGD